MKPCTRHSLMIGTQVYYTISKVISALGLKLNTFVKNDEIVEDMAKVA